MENVGQQESTFVPALVETIDQGATIRHFAGCSNFIEVQQDLLKRFDRWGLVVRKGEANGGAVEVAHEALFRTWKRLGTRAGAAGAASVVAR